MTAINLFFKKHRQIANRLNIEKARLFKKHTEKDISLKIAPLVRVSPVTVINYLHGKVKDGYLAEVILSELKKIK